jgi:hypothetical protein
MPLHRDRPASRHARGRARLDTPGPSARRGDTDGVLVLHIDDEPPSRSAPIGSTPEDDTLAPLRAERDAALEEVAYLEEQLRSLIAYHRHLLDEERQRMFDERTQLATELATLREGLQRRTYPGGSADWTRSGSPTSDADVTDEE